jgi:hypothetical protein
MKAFLKTAVILGLLLGTAQAQPVVDGSARSSYVSVMSKAGTPQSRPSVPVRYVQLPPGAQGGSDYYYGYRYRNGVGSPTPSFANQPAPSTSSTLPGYDTRPRSSYSDNGSRKRKRR